ncbi:30S ribosome-binding factor RbfA [Buchnera aphidicola]|uniref:30S ribosome-binding factor RbfA n=1 Tax=Buchnera aphidicola TaxID=9 RepID=UPI00346448D3
MKYINKNYSPNFHRSTRIAEDLKKSIAIILQKDIRDPRINFKITVTSIKLSHDLSYAKVFFSYFNDHHTFSSISDNMNNVQNIIFVLQRSSGYIRKNLFHNMKLRKIPILKFYHDDSLLEGMKISKLLKNI